jgi:hypothetical protein
MILVISRPYKLFDVGVLIFSKMTRFDQIDKIMLNRPVFLQLEKHSSHGIFVIIRITSCALSNI